MSTEKQRCTGGDYETPSEFPEFVEFTNRLNIPLNKDYLSQMRAEQMKTGSLNQDLSAVEVGVKNSKVFSSDKQQERRLQNAIWRAWWRQRRARFNADPRVDDDEELLATDRCLQNKLEIEGSQIGDIPTHYSVPSLKPHELPAVGTYVDKNIIPGFKFRVRLNGTDEYLFDNEALSLLSIGQGYGKRLTFESDDLLENPNFFWSDSNHDDGYGFSIQVVNVGNRLAVFDCQERQVAEAVVTMVEDAQQIEHSSVYSEARSVELQVRVKVECKLHFISDDYVPENMRGSALEIPVSGLVIARKTPENIKARSIEIRQDVVIPVIGKCFMRFE